MASKFKYVWNDGAAYRQLRDGNLPVPGAGVEILIEGKWKPYDHEDWPEMMNYGRPIEDPLA